MSIHVSFLAMVLATGLFSGALEGAQGSLTPSQDSYRTEEMTLKLGRFSVAGDLIRPRTGGKHPTLIVVPGDGPFTRAQGVRFLKSLGLFDYLMSEGFAVFIDDKPGSGASTGELSEEHLFRERATILSQWVEQLKKNPAVDGTHIGFFGVSQAGYVMPLVLAESPEVAFMIAVSCPAEDTLAQFVYLVEQQMKCEGYPEAEAHRVSLALMKRETARDYQDYREAAERVAANPVASDQAGGDILSEEQFKPANLDSEYFFNPNSILETITVPVLALFGAKDTLIDPIQGSEAYSKALEAAGDPFFRVKVIPGVDHILSLAETGCEKELMEKLMTRSVVYTPDYLASIREWLTELKTRWNS